jgi:hypothetical protein
MKKGEGENKHSRRITMSVTAAISPNESNWGGRGGCLGFLVYLFFDVNVYQYSVVTSVGMYQQVVGGMNGGVGSKTGFFKNS